MNIEIIINILVKNYDNKVNLINYIINVANWNF